MHSNSQSQESCAGGGVGGGTKSQIARQVGIQRSAILRLATVALLMFCGSTLFGGVVFDGSLGKSGPAPLANSNYMIPASFGKQVGTNLFQSFSQFNLISSESATFTGPSNIQNVLSRVTGGSPSSIDGTINSDIQGANLFFLNPVGVIFGPHAQLNVSGSVAISTANYLKLSDGGRFNASLGDDSMLTAAPVSAFGFLNSANAGVSITGSTLNVALNACFSVVSGDITMTGGSIGPRQGGSGPARVNLLSVNSPGEAGLLATDPNSGLDVSQFARLGEIDLINAFVGTFQPIGGGIAIRASVLHLDNSFVASTVAGVSQGGPKIDIAGGDIYLNNNSSIDSASDGGGAVEIAASGSLKISNGSRIFTVSFGHGNAGDITVRADAMQISDLPSEEGFGIGGVSTTAAGFSGAGGNITLIANSFLLDTAAIQSSAGSSGTETGNISIIANNIKIINGGRITENVEDGLAGDITVTAAGALEITSRGNIRAETVGSGSAGNLVLKAQTIDISDSGSLSTTTSEGSGDAGTISLTASSVTLDSGGHITSQSGKGSDDFGTGNAGSISITSNSLSVSGDSSTISVLTQSPGNAGDINIKSGSVIVEQGGKVDSSTEAGVFGPAGRGQGGSIEITAGSLDLDRGFITASSSSSGNAGTIVVHANDIGLTSGGEISSSTFGVGDGGKVNVSADLLSIDDATITASTFASGHGGDLTLNIESLVLANGGGLSARTQGSGDAGNVTVHASDATITNGSSISATTFSSGNAGTITIQIDGKLLITDPFHSSGFTGIDSGSFPSPGVQGGNAGSIQITAGVILLNGSINTATDYKPGGTTTGSGGKGGSIQIDANTMTINDGAVTADTFDSSGNAGNVIVRVNDLILTDGGFIDSGTFRPGNLGNGGNVEVTANSLLINGAGGSASQTGIFAVSDDGSKGIGGKVTVNAGSLSLQNGGAVSATSSTAAAAGSVDLDLGTLSMDSGSSISSANTGSGSAGTVFIGTTGSVKLKNKSKISTSSQLSDAGNITINSGGVVKLSSGSEITASAGTNGGSIEIKAPSLVYLLNSSIKATAGLTGGNITVDPLFIILNNSPISASAGSQGGKITLQSSFFLDSNSPITATGGVANGTINITAPELDLGAELITLSGSLVDPQNQLQERCTALLQGDFSSFISIGRGGTEPEPDEPQEEF